LDGALSDPALVVQVIEASLAWWQATGARSVWLDLGPPNHFHAHGFEMHRIKGSAAIALNV